jgi:1-deoxy-D-xylulose-5-phosphate reductoisomerase
MRNIAVLGSTGSIGRSTLEVAEAFAGELRVVGLGARRNIDLLREQIERFKPRLVAVSDSSKAEELRALVGDAVEVTDSQQGIIQLATMEDADIVVSAMVGAVGLEPTLGAVRARKQVALANKEVLVCGGEIVMKEAAAAGVEILPIDSEHSALHQCLRTGKRSEVERLILTASGGPFLEASSEEMMRATPDEALKHPRWAMGTKVTIDSATMMNKALEMIEARWLFDVEPEKIDVLVHPESVVHSMVQYADGVTIAQMSPADMRIPVQYALLYPKRSAGRWGSVKLEELGELHFRRPDPGRFPAIRLGRLALRTGGTLPTVMNAANEIAVERFLKAEIALTAISILVERVMREHRVIEKPSLDDIMQADRWAREKAREVR